MLTFIHPEDYGNEPPIFSGYGLGLEEWIPQLLPGEYGYGPSGSIPGYRAFMAHLPEHELTIVVLSNSDKEQKLGAVIDALLVIVLEKDEQDLSTRPAIDLEPVIRPRENATVMKAFSNQALFWDRRISWSFVTSP